MLQIRLQALSWPSIAALVITAFALAACGDNEAAQRKSFIEFLQTRIIDKPGVHVPQLNAELESKLGGYAKHYAVITTFHSGMDESVSGFFNKAVRVASVTSIADAVQRRDDIAAARAQIAAMRATLGEKLAAAEAARAGLAQPDDLKPVYEAAFDRDVRSTVKGFQSELPLYEDALGSMLKLADFINSHRDKLALQGPSITANHSKTLAEVNALLQEVNQKSARLQDSQRRLNKIVTGS
jgi:Protein of unknown function (DUF3053)